MTHTSSADGPEFSGEHFREIVQAAIDAAITMNFDGTVLNWNDAAATLLGWSSKEAIGSSLAELIVPERNRKLLADRLADRLLAFRAGDEQPTEVRRFKTDALHKDGYEIPVELSIAPSQLDRTLLFTAFVRDLRAELAETEERGRLAAIVESSTDAIIGRNLAGIITSWNTGAQRVYGHSAEEAIGQPVSIMIPDEVAGEEPELREVLTGGQKLQSFEVVRRRNDGRQSTTMRE
jgi:PAS domain S-box-containing protein